LRDYVAPGDECVCSVTAVQPGCHISHESQTKVIFREVKSAKALDAAAAARKGGVLAEAEAEAGAVHPGAGCVNRGVNTGIVVSLKPLSGAASVRAVGVLHRRPRSPATLPVAVPGSISDSMAVVRAGDGASDVPSLLDDPQGDSQRSSSAAASMSASSAGASVAALNTNATSASASASASADADTDVDFHLALGSGLDAYQDPGTPLAAPSISQALRGDHTRAKKLLNARMFEGTGLPGASPAYKPMHDTTAPQSTPAYAGYGGQTPYHGRSAPMYAGASPYMTYYGSGNNSSTNTTSNGSVGVNAAAAAAPAASRPSYSYVSDRYAPGAASMPPPSAAQPVLAAITRNNAFSNPRQVQLHMAAYAIAPYGSFLGKPPTFHKHVSIFAVSIHAPVFP
jgi:hypothetical protein